MFYSLSRGKVMTAGLLHIFVFINYVRSFSQQCFDAQPKKACLISINAISSSLLVFRMGPILDELNSNKRAI